MYFPFLQKTSVWNALSSLGKQVYTPKGIFYWSMRAKREAEIDGTIGIAQDDDGSVSHLRVAEQWAGEKVMAVSPKARVFGYAPIEGLESLRKKWLARILQEHPGLEQYATMPVVTNGITHGIALASRLLLEAGETIVTSDKSWENYDHIFHDVQGVKMTTFPLFTSKSELNLKRMHDVCKEIALGQKKLVLLLNFPHNQTGYMPSHRQALAIGQHLHELCRALGPIPFVILLDDAYEGYVYDDRGQMKSLLSELFTSLPNLTVVKMDGISKVMLAYGYRVGFLTWFLNSLDGDAFSPAMLQGLREEMGTKMGGLIRGEISQVNHHGQILADQLMDVWDIVGKERTLVIERLRERWSVLMQTIDECFAQYGNTKLSADLCNGGFFCYLNLAAGIDPKNIAERLLTEKKVGVVPSEQGLRIAFAGVPKEKISRMIKAIFEIVYGKKFDF